MRLPGAQFRERTYPTKALAGLGRTLLLVGLSSLLVVGQVSRPPEVPKSRGWSMTLLYSRCCTAPSPTGGVSGHQAEGSGYLDQ